MNDKPGGAPNPMNAGSPMGTGVGAWANPGQKPTTNTPSNFGARPAPSMPPIKPIQGPASFGQRPGTISGGSGATPGAAAVGAMRNPGSGTGFTTGAGGVSGGNNAAVAGASQNNASGTTKVGGIEVLKAPGVGMTNPTNNGAGKSSSNNGVSITLPNQPTERNEAVENEKPSEAKEDSVLERPLTEVVQQPQPVQPQKDPAKKKKAIIGAVVGVSSLLLIVVVAVVAVLMLNRSGPVAKAMDKILNGQANKNVAVNGEISVKETDLTKPLSHYNVTLSASGIPASFINETNMTVTMGGQEVDDMTFQMDEIYAGGHDLYFRMDGMMTALQDYSDALFINYQKELLAGVDNCIGADCETTNTDTTEGENGDEAAGDEAADDEMTEEEKNKQLAIAEPEEGVIYYDLMSEVMDVATLDLILAVGDSIDGEWIQLPTDNGKTEGENSENGEAAEGEAEGDGATEAESGTAEGDSAEGQEGNEASTDESNLTMEVLKLIGLKKLGCGAVMMNTVRDNMAMMVQQYRQNPFIGSTQEGVTVASKKYPVYQIVIDVTKYQNFINALNAMKMFDNYLTCSEETVDDLLNFPNTMPAVYAEVDSEANFSRFYWKADSARESTVVNLDLSYPANINVSEPPEYETLENVFVGVGIIDMAAEEGEEVEQSETSGE